MFNTNMVIFFLQLLVSLFEVMAFGSDTSTIHQVQFKELLKDLFEVTSSTVYTSAAHCNSVNVVLSVG